jgi:excisionase family DNA binding protein
MLQNMERDSVTFITTSQAARRLSVAEGTIRSWERSGRLHAQRAGLVRLFDVKDIERLAIEREEQARVRAAA